MFVQTFISQSAVERLNVRILIGLPGSISRSNRACKRYAVCQRGRNPSEWEGRAGADFGDFRETRSRSRRLNGPRGLLSQSTRLERKL
jgi:hypothetical protein